MGFNCGIVGLPNVGKSTIFNAITKVGVASENYPFCTIDPSIGRVNVPDPRLAVITQFIPPQKLVPAGMEFVDIAGLVRGASKGEGLGNQFLGNIRSTDAMLHVVRCFASDDIIHVEGSVDPVRDIETIDTELIFADISTVEKAVQRYSKMTKGGDKANLKILEVMTKLNDHLQGLVPARRFKADVGLELADAVGKAMDELHLLTAKKVLYVCNVDESLASGTEDNEYTLKVRERAKADNAEVIILCGKLEEELSQMSDEDAKEFISELGMTEPGLNRLIRSGYKALGLQTYFTAGEKEVRAWTIKVGDTAPAAAGKIHSDFERGFICAEVYTVEDLKNAKSKVKLKETGKIRTEGREYIVQDGDVMEFRFNV